MFVMPFVVSVSFLRNNERMARESNWAPQCQNTASEYIMHKLTVRCRGTRPNGMHSGFVNINTSAL